MKPLVSILISAYNAEKWIAYTLESAVAQTWAHKEIIVVDDGSTDSTAEIARRFASQGVTVVSTENRGPAAGRNYAFGLSQGDFIQWLDADDILAPDKIEQQLMSLRGEENRRILLSSPWAPFYYRTSKARFVHNSLCQDLSPAEWLLRKMRENSYTQTSTWLASRELIEAAGYFDSSLCYDDDGEYFCRVLLASEGTKFVPDAKVFYRITPSRRVSNIGNSDRKKESLLRSMKLHIQYLRSLEDSERVREACLIYLQNWYFNFYPERPDLVREAQNVAAKLGGELEQPHLRWKYDWMRLVFGWGVAKWTQMTLPHVKQSFIRQWDKMAFLLQSDWAAENSGTHTPRLREGRQHSKAPHVVPQNADSPKMRLPSQQAPRRQLVSILIPAFNAEKWIEYSLRSAVAQTWPHKEIIVVDDGSTDHTAEIARRFASKGVLVISSGENEGVAMAQNRAIDHSQGDFVQILAADDILAPDKIERQMVALRGGENRRVLLSSPWAPFYYRTNRVRFVYNSLCEDLSPVEWLLRKMRENLHMQPSTWLTSRELIEAAGYFDSSLRYDDDGEYFCRVLLASEGTKYVPEAKVFYRITPSSRVSYIGNSDRKRESLLRSMKLHIQYLRSLEDSKRVREACLIYLQNWYHNFYPDRPDLVTEMQRMASQLGGQLDEPHLRWKYSWMKPLLGWETAKWAQNTLPQFKASCVRQYDKAMYTLEERREKRGKDVGDSPPSTPVEIAAGRSDT